MLRRLPRYIAGASASMRNSPLIIVRPCPDRFEGRAGAYAPSPSRPNLVLDGFTVIEISAIEFRFTDGVPVQVLFTCPICSYLPDGGRWPGTPCRSGNCDCLSSRSSCAPRGGIRTAVSTGADGHIAHFSLFPLRSFCRRWHRSPPRRLRPARNASGFNPS